MGRMIEQRPINEVIRKDDMWSQVTFTILTSELRSYVFDSDKNNKYIMIEKRRQSEINE